MKSNIQTNKKKYINRVCSKADNLDFNSSGSAFDLANLTSLQLNYFSQKNIQAILKYCPNLKQLISRHCYSSSQHYISTQIMSMLSQMNSLQKLDIRNSYQGNSYNWLYPLKNLRSLSLGNQRLSLNEFTSLVKQLSNLQQLFLIQARIKESWIQSLSGLHLVSFGLRNVSCISKGVLTKLVSSHKNINSLTFDQCGFENTEQLFEIKALSNLKSLNISRTFIQDYVINTILSGLPNLQQLSLRYRDIESQQLEQILRKCPKLFNFKINTKVSDEQLFIISIYGRNISSLFLQGNQQITKLGIQTLLNNLPNIIELNLSWCSSLNNSTMKVISKFKDLTQLNLNQCKLTDQGLVNLGKLKKLCSLNLRESKISKQCLNKLFVNFPSLKKIFISQLIDCKRNIRQFNENIQNITNSWIKYYK